jgi:hypothetical protein
VREREKAVSCCYGRDWEMGGRGAGVLQWLQHPESSHGVAVLLAFHWHSSGDALLRPTLVSLSLLILFRASEVAFLFTVMWWPLP